MKSKDWAAFILLGLVWGTSFLWIKIAVREIGPLLLVALRLLIGILGLFFYVAWTHPKFPLNRQTWVQLTILGLINNAIPYLLISWGEIYIDSAVAAILNSTAPLFTMVLAHFILTDDPMTKKRVIALLVGFLGIIILMERDLNGSFGRGFLGQAAVLLAALFYSISSIYARRITSDQPAAIRAILPLIGADILIWLLTPLVEKPLVLPHLSLTWLAVIWLGVMGVSLAYILYFYLLHSVGPTRTILVTYVFPLMGVILGVLFLGEKLDWNLVVGGSMIIGGIVLVNRQ
ncbi:MAG: DMT family transporter [Anaerolineales bacterium]